MIRLLTLVAALLVAAAAPVSAGGVNGFDVLGIRIGMTADEVESVAASKGLQKEATFPAPSFEQQFALANGGGVAAKDYAGLQSMTFEGDAKRRSSLLRRPRGRRRGRSSTGTGAQN